MLTELDLAVLNRTEPLDAVVERIIQSRAKPLTLLVAEIADVKQSVFELPSELRAAALRDQVSNLARLRRERILRDTPKRSVILFHVL